MNILYKYAVGMLLLSSAACTNVYKVEVSDSSGSDRNGEMAVIPLKDIPNAVGQSFIVKDGANQEIPYQITHDSLLIFQADVSANGTSTYKIVKGSPMQYDTLACGMYRPDRKDDFIWENDKSGYRTYGPALQASGERAFGYDVFTKSVSFPVMKARFDSALYAKNKLNFHLDHGNGMDSYGVGPTLGCGTTALVKNGELVYPWAWTSYEILDNGPLRFSIRLKYSPVAVNGKEVVETRTITLDAGSYLNHAVVSYDGLVASGMDTLAVGIVVHKENPDAYRSSERYMAYADLGDRNIGQNGEIYTGVVFCSTPDSVGFIPFEDMDETLSSNKIGAPIGHILGTSVYSKNTEYSYYFGSGWSKGGVRSFDEWCSYLQGFSERLKSPLNIKISK
jgi:hypothetical protein